MTTRGRTTPILAAAAGVLLIAVIADRLGLIPGRGAVEVGGGSGLRARYLARLGEVSAERALLAQAGAWASARAEAEARWRQVRASLVSGATPELAESRFRELVMAAFDGIRVVSPPRITYVREGDAPASGPIRPIRLRVEFDAPTHRDAYALVDRLENLADTRAEVTSLKIDGPGRIQVPEQVTVSLMLTSVAVVGEAS